MRKMNFMLMLLAALAVCSCSENESLVNEESGEKVKVAFRTQPEAEVVLDTRSAPGNYVDATKFTFFAFKKQESGKFSYEKTISDPSATYGGKIWNSDQSLLTVGTYRFFCIYNLGSVKLPDLTSLKEMTWEEIRKGFVLEHTTENADVDEFFCEEAKGGEVQIVTVSEEENKNNEIVVAFNDLKRVVARIDVKFVKVTADKKNEEKYGDGNDIFGKTGNLKSVRLDVKGLANKFSLGETVLTDTWGTMQSFAFSDMDDLLVIGESAEKSVFPTTDNLENMNDKVAMKKGIIKGGAYFRGAYILPFANEDTKLEQLKINLVGKDGGNRIITSTQGQDLAVTTNYITLVTVKLISNGGGDPENLFDPEVGFEVMVDQVYAGIWESEIEIE